MSNSIAPRRVFPTPGKKAIPDDPSNPNRAARAREEATPPPAAKPVNRIAIRPNPSAATVGKPPAAKKPLTPKEVTDEDLNKLVGGMEAGKKPPKKPTQPVQQEDLEEAEEVEEEDAADGDVWDDEDDEESEEVAEEEEEVAEEAPPVEEPVKRGKGRPPGTGKHQIAGRAPVDTPKKETAPAKPRNYADPAQRPAPAAVPEKAVEVEKPRNYAAPAAPKVAVSADTLEILGQQIADLTEQVAQLKRQAKAVAPAPAGKADLAVSIAAFLNALTAKILNS